MEALSKRCFDRLIINDLIGLIYVLGVVAVIIIAFMVSNNDPEGFGYDGNYMGGFNWLRFFTVSAVGMLAWRLWCEMMFVVFLIHGVLRDILSELRNTRTKAEAA
ncbi:MAG TPA: DUF4282 domain-containing protein [Candidatus Hydrogenedentes bacterium]|nr:DUF4282 domain-containing protein [Candidatus Hydrogenedentota bacterium]HPG68278.1 DUF4282 domain-containing protein [Candidatus Hydrogenedentota bacterium]